MGHGSPLLLTGRRLRRLGVIRRPGATRFSKPDQDIHPGAIEADGYILSAEHLATEIPCQLAHADTKCSSCCRIVPVVTVANHTVGCHKRGQPITGNGYPR